MPTRCGGGTRKGHGTRTLDKADEAMAALKGLLGRGGASQDDGFPTPPQSPAGFQARPVGDPNIPDGGSTAGDWGPSDVRDLGPTARGTGDSPQDLSSVLDGLRASQDLGTSGKLFGLQTNLRDELARNLEKANGAGSAFQTGGSHAAVTVAR
jgi:hypothetical protein